MFYSEHLLKFLLLICIYYISKLYFKDLCFGPSASFQFTVNLHCFSPRTILYLHLKSYILFALLPNYWPPGRYLNPGELFLSFFHLKTECFSSFFPSLSVWYKSRFLNNWPICFVFIFILFYNQFQNRTKKKKNTILTLLLALLLSPFTSLAFSPAHSWRRWWWWRWWNKMQ